MKLSPLVMLGLAACSGAAARPQPPIDQAAPPPDLATAPAPAVTPIAPGFLLALDADLDGDGAAEAIRVSAKGMLWIDAAAQAAEIDRQGDAWSPDASLTVVDLDATDGAREVLFAQPTADDEDPPLRYQIYRLAADGSVRRILDQVIGVYNPTPLVFPGDGTVRYVQTGWMACLAQGNPTVAQLDEVTLGLRGGQLVQIARAPTAATQVCDQLAG
jgi:hypothetical protein